MRHGRQICEGCDYHEGTYCLSQAHWKVTLIPWRFWHAETGKMRTAAATLTLYLCTTCHAMAEYDWGEKAVPRKTEYSEAGWEAQPGHEQPLARHAAAFADVSNARRLTGQQLSLRFDNGTST
jgi:hypothetical protein